MTPDSPLTCRALPRPALPSRAREQAVTNIPIPNLLFTAISTGLTK